MRNIFINFLKILLVLILINFYSFKANSEDINSIVEQLQILQKDIKTLEKAVYSKDINNSYSSSELSNNNNDILTKHLLKLSELEDQFKSLTNQFEEINFRLDKLSNRITKIQTDNQVRFQDLENSTISSSSKSLAKKEKKLPGSSEPQGLR